MSAQWPLPAAVQASEPASEPDFNTLEQAAEWYAVLRSGSVSAAERRGWQEWCQASPANRAAWQRVEAISSGMSLPREQPLAAEAALSAAERLRKRRRTIKALSLLAVVGLGGWSASRTQVWQNVQAGIDADFSTGVGQMRELVLQEGSQVWLNTSTALDQRYDDVMRLLILRRGEIMVATHPDDRGPARPFVVESLHGRMRALGTRFNVRQMDDATELSVFEGRVEVTTASGTERRIIDTGQRVTFTQTRMDAVSEAGQARAMWSKGILLADDLPLGDVVAELSRYRRGRLACDPAVASLRVVGGYPLDNPDQALAMLQAALPIEVYAVMPWWITVRARR
ncbi:sensor [Oxalicibacterium flavum]|uniref:Sensor n=1 Tax=Oxalicibacterium flavum TaxID=179467 RepID=A0A8J2UN88_9BURK|nr:FecR domain-containing protein [Oxalicibacterium flavum]GGC12829.1 sensor [Oxalicibacterium flavum]